MQETRTWVNGKEGTGGLLLDEGLLYGRGVFETIRVGEGPWFLDEHLARLHHGAEQFGMSSSLTREDVLGFCRTQGVRDCALRVTLTPANIILSVRPLPYTDLQKTEGIRVLRGRTRRNPFSPLVGVKSIGYMESLLERERAKAADCAESLLLNIDNELAEGSASNLFFVRHGSIHTPLVSCGILPGIVRGYVLRENEVKEGRYDLNDLLDADEVFMTNCLMGIMGVQALSGERTWEIGPVTRALQEAYEQYPK